MEVHDFDDFNGSELISDPEGRALSDFAAVRAEADADARELIAGAVLRGERIGNQELRVRDSAKQILRMNFSELLELQRA